MKYLNHKILMLMLLFYCFNDLRSQGYEQNGVIPFLKQKGLIIYAGVGKTYPNKAIVTNAFVPNTFEFNLKAFIPIVKSEKFSFGFQTGGAYFYGNQSTDAIRALSYNIIGQQASPAMSINSNGSPMLTGFNCGFGPQLNFLVGERIIISPILELGIIGLFNHSFKVLQSTTVNNVNTETRNYELYNQANIDGSGLEYISPKIKLQYFFNNHLGLWMELEYLIGPATTIDTYFTKLTPKGNPNDNNEYSISQMDAGTYDKYTSSTVYSSFGLNFGIAIKLPPLVHRSR